MHAYTNMGMRIDTRIFGYCIALPKTIRFSDNQKLLILPNSLVLIHLFKTFSTINYLLHEF